MKICIDVLLLGLIGSVYVYGNPPLPALQIVTRGIAHAERAGWYEMTSRTCLPKTSCLQASREASDSELRLRCVAPVSTVPTRFFTIQDSRVSVPKRLFSQVSDVADEPDASSKKILHDKVLQDSVVPTAKYNRAAFAMQWVGEPHEHNHFQGNDGSSSEDTHRLFASGYYTLLGCCTILSAYYHYQQMQQQPSCLECLHQEMIELIRDSAMAVTVEQVGDAHIQLTNRWQEYIVYCETLKEKEKATRFALQRARKCHKLFEKFSDTDGSIRKQEEVAAAEIARLESEVMRLEVRLQAERKRRNLLLALFQEIRFRVK